MSWDDMTCVIRAPFHVTTLMQLVWWRLLGVNAALIVSVYTVLNSNPGITLQCLPVKGNSKPDLRSTGNDPVSLIPDIAAALYSMHNITIRLVQGVTANRQGFWELIPLQWLMGDDRACYVHCVFPELKIGWNTCNLVKFSIILCVVKIMQNSQRICKCY